MPATTPHIDPGVLMRLRSGDEGALEQTFRDLYPALMQEAKPLLDDAGAAARVVEGVFVRAWQSRAAFETPESMETFLHEGVHDGALRERKRLAAIHRFEEREHVNAAALHRNGHEPTVAEAWKKVNDALHATHADPAKLAHMKADMSRHHAAEHMAQIAKPRPILVPALIGLVFLAIVAAGFWWLDRMSRSAELSKALARPETRILDTKPGQRGNLTLDDGTGVSLGADSRLFVPPGFGVEIRGVKLEGTALFSPKAGEMPFQVRVRDATVTTTGTVFAVRSYVGEPLAIVMVREGSLTIESGDSTRALATGQAVAIDSAGVLSTPAEGAVSDALAWLDGRLRMTDRPVGDVLAEVRKWYALALNVNEARLLERKVTVDASLESSREVIGALESGAKLVFGYSRDGTQMMLRDGERVK